ncbi:MAG: heme o synthase [Pirellulales bacterium]
MSTSTLAYERRRVGLLTRARDYVDLTRPRIALMVLITVAVGAVAGSWGPPDVRLLLHAAIGTTLIAASAGALNQWLERETDARMDRTAGRPLPSGRLSAWQAVTFGLATAALGLAWLAAAVNIGTALLGAVTWLLYVWVYTPLKSRSPSNTAVGAVAGAMPVLMGWAAVGGPLDLHAATLFLIVYLWQFPHFMAIAWLYRRQYALAGLQMLPVVDPSGRRAGAQAVVAGALLVVVSLIPASHLLSPARAPWYLLGAVVLGIAQLLLAVRFKQKLNDETARALLRASLVYLPSLLMLFMASRLL